MITDKTNYSSKTNKIIELFIYSKDLFVHPIIERSDIKLITSKKAGVYLWYNKVTNNYYVGSSNNLYKRLSRYYQESYLKYPNHCDLPIVRAVVKYGLDNFILVILDYTTEFNIYELEQYYIDSLLPIYNIRQIAGFRSGKRILKKSLSEEHKLKLSLKRGIYHHSYGIKRPLEVIDLIRKNHPKTKKLYQYLEDKVTLVAQYNSIREMQKKTGMTKEYVSRCIKANLLVHNKYFFSFIKLNF
jgi:GIY-YIG catalytic domain-containing protein